MHIFKIIKKYKSAVSSLSLYLSSNLIQVVIGLLLNPVWASNLSHYDYSVLGYFDSFVLFSTPLISFAFFSYYSKVYFNINELEQKKTLSTLVIAQFIGGFITTILVLIALYYYLHTNVINFPFYPYALLTIIRLFFSNVITFFLLDLRLKRNAKSYFKLNLCYILLTNILLLLFVYFLKLGAFGYMLGTFVATLGLCIFILWKLRNGIYFNLPILKNAISFTWPLILAAQLTYFFSGYDRLLLANINDITNFGLYNIGVKFASYFIVFSTAINSTFEPDFFKAISTNNKSLLRNILLLINGSKLILAIIFIILSVPIVGFLTNYRYLDSVIYARILVLSTISQSISFSLSSILIAKGYSKYSLLEKILGAVFSVFIYTIMIKKFQFIGAAWANVIVYIQMAIISASILLYLSYRNK